MSDLPPRVALARPQAAGASTSEPHDFTDAQVEEYREQDRYLPVRCCPPAPRPELAAAASN